MFTGEYRSSREHFCEDAAYWPNVYGFGIALHKESCTLRVQVDAQNVFSCLEYIVTFVWEKYLRVKHDFRSSIPPRGHVFCEEARMIVVRIRDSRQTEIADLKVTGGIQQQITRFQVSV